MNETSEVIAILGGAGALGSGLARRLRLAGYRVIVGSRRSAASLAGGAAEPEAEVMGYVEAAAAAGLVVLTVPFAAQADTIAAVRPQLQGKLLIDCTVPLQRPKVGLVQLPPQGSAAAIARAAAGDGVAVAAAFHNVSARLLQADGPIDCDVLVFADDVVVRARVARLVNQCGLRPIEGGPLDNAAAAEALTSVLIQINRRYKSGHAGIRITGIEPGIESGAHG